MFTHYAAANTTFPLSPKRISERDEKKSLTTGGIYKVTLHSSTEIGAFDSNGTAIIAKLPDNSYEIKVAFIPDLEQVKRDHPLAYYFAIQQPFYIHAVAKESSEPNKFLCSGKVYVTKASSKIIDGENLEVELTEKIESKHNTYKFFQTPLSLWGYSPGKMENSGNLTKVTENAKDEVRIFEKIWKDEELDIKLKLPSLGR